MSSLDEHRENDIDCGAKKVFPCLFTIIFLICTIMVVLFSIVLFILFILSVSVILNSPTTSVEVGGNVPVLLNLSGFDPLRYDQVQVTGLTAGSNSTLLFGLCEDLSTVRVPLRPKNIFKSSTKSALPFNYYGGDTPVYSAGGNSSFISFNISAEATGDSQNDSHQSCAAQLMNFDNLTSYMEFVHNQTTYQPLSSCIPVGPPGAPSTTSVTFSLHEPGFYRQAVFVNTTLSINSSVTGSLSSYNTSSLEQVFCNTKDCTISISTLPSTQNASTHVCILVLTGEYTAVEFRGYQSTSFHIAIGVTLGLLLCIVCCAIFPMVCIVTWADICKETETSQTVSYKHNSVFFTVSIVCYRTCHASVHRH